MNEGNDVRFLDVRHEEEGQIHKFLTDKNVF